MRSEGFEWSLLVITFFGGVDLLSWILRLEFPSEDIFLIGLGLWVVNVDNYFKTDTLV